MTNKEINRQTEAVENTGLENIRPQKLKINIHTYSIKLRVQGGGALPSPRFFSANSHTPHNVKKRGNSRPPLKIPDFPLPLIYF